ncbi:hypothetical protein [Paenibacillus agricola]|uniref:hypothetical protein n=1 Tax=Paenibacillus agricola TaxID=2716264 RepID=UPI001A9F31EE|nr:hypothetical protein [Paenibacillus agricola]
MPYFLSWIAVSYLFYGFLSVDCIVYLSSITGIDPDYYEAAALDGASKWVPLNAGALFDVTNVIETYVYRALINSGDIGMSSAASTFQAFVGFALVNIGKKCVAPRN